MRQSLPRSSSASTPYLIDSAYILALEIKCLMTKPEYELEPHSRTAGGLVLNTMKLKILKHYEIVKIVTLAGACPNKKDLKFVLLSGLQNLN